MAAKPYRPKMTAAEKKAYKNRNFGVQGKTGGMGGKYGRKSTNLSQKQLKAAGAAKAAKKRTVDISQTRREGNVTLGPGGKPLTGTVNLGGGKTAVYKGGKRVQAGPAAGRAKKPKAQSGGTRTTQSRAASIPTTRPSAAQTGAGAGGRTGPGPSAQQVAAQARQRRNQNRPPQSLRPTTAKPARGARRKVRQGDFVITYEWDGTRWTQAQKTRVTG